MPEISREDLATSTGKDGRPTRIAVQGKVYDLSDSLRWKHGLHMKRHHAGVDLTTDLKAAPHGPEVLDKFPQVGILAAAADPQRPLPAGLNRLLERFPMLRRHPHPMTVHFPIAFMLAATGFNLLYVVSGRKAFEVTGYHCLGAGIVFGLVAICTGLYTWWLNYLAQPVRAVSIKKRLSPLMLVVAAVAFGWRTLAPEILTGVHTGSVVYFILILSLVPLVTVIGWFGAEMTFPIQDD